LLLGEVGIGLFIELKKSLRGGNGGSGRDYGGAKCLLLRRNRVLTCLCARRSADTRDSSSDSTNRDVDKAVNRNFQENGRKKIPKRRRIAIDKADS